MSSGKFITIEGGEGSGKSTQMRLLSESLSNIGAEAVLTREPGGTRAGEAIRELLLSPDYELTPRTEALLHFAARMEHVEQVIRPALKDGKIVVCDRYTDSTVAYQGYGHQLGEIWVEHLHSLTVADILPDITFILDIDPETGLKRAASRREGKNRYESQNLAFHRRVREGFLAIAHQESSRCIVIDASQKLEDIHRQMVDTLNQYYKLKLSPVIVESAKMTLQ